MSILNSLSASDQMLQQQLLQQQQLQSQVAQVAIPKSVNAGGDSNNNTANAVSAPEDRDAASYKQHYELAIHEGHTPDAAAKIAYKNSAPVVNSEAGAHGKDDRAAAKNQQSLSGENTASQNRGTDAAANASTPTRGTPLSPEAAAAKTSAPPTALAPPKPDVVDTTPRPYSQNLQQGGRQPSALPPETEAAAAGAQRGSFSGVDEMFNSPSSHKTMNASTMYNVLTTDNATSPEDAELYATNTTADLTPDAAGNVQAGTVGTIPLGDAAKKLLALPAADKSNLDATTQNLVIKPDLARSLAASNSSQETLALVQKGIADNTIQAAGPKDADGKSLATTPGGAKKSARSLNPMEMVMLAMMQAAVEGQAQARAVAEQVQANTALKAQLRGEKTDLMKQMTDQKVPTTGAETTATGSDKPVALTADQKALQQSYQNKDDQISNAGDDSSILMIQLQTAAQIVTTFLQACSNVSKGVTDTTKAVIGNIGH